MKHFYFWAQSDKCTQAHVYEDTSALKYQHCIWNSLPVYLRYTQTYRTFKKYLQAQIFQKHLTNRLTHLRVSIHLYNGVCVWSSF